jgi:uncharacterized protein (AIM24 family)
LRDLTELHWASSTCQLDTGVVPVVEVTLAPEDSVFFEHHAMLWKDETVPMSVMNTPGGAKRLLSGMPFVLSVARGPGRVAFARDAPGEVIVIPVDAPAEVDVREHALVMASATLSYSFEKLPGVRAMLTAGTGMYLDRYVAQGAPGLLVLHGYGNVFERVLAQGETILVQPGAFFYKDAAVGMEVVSVNFKASPGTAPGPEAATADVPAEAPAAPAPAQGGGGMFGRGLKGLKAAKSMLNVGAITSAASNLRQGGGLTGVASGLMSGGGSTFLRMTGPGRVGVQSMYQPHKTE